MRSEVYQENGKWFWRCCGWFEGAFDTREGAEGDLADHKETEGHRSRRADGLKTVAT